MEDKNKVDELPVLAGKGTQEDKKPAAEPLMRDRIDKIRETFDLEASDEKRHDSIPFKASIDKKPSIAPIIFHLAIIVHTLSG